MSKVSSGSLRLSGNAFQTDGLATENARQPNVFRRQRGTMSFCWAADRATAGNWRVGVQTIVNKSPTYTVRHTRCVKADPRLATSSIRDEVTSWSTWRHGCWASDRSSDRCDVINWGLERSRGLRRQVWHCQPRTTDECRHHTTRYDARRECFRL